MPRTTDEAVAGIIETDEDIPLTPFIEVANELVTEVCGSVTTYTTTRLELIERWLSAHFYAIRDPRSTREEVEGIRDTYESKVDLGFDLTRYGQQAMRLDTNGGLAALNNAIKNAKSSLPAVKKMVGMTWLGTERDCVCNTVESDD